MISVEAWTTIRYLKAQGLGTRTIARELGISRNTVRRALKGDGPPRYRRPRGPNPQLEPFAGDIRKMLFEQRFIGTRIMRELRLRGYQGPHRERLWLMAAISADGLQRNTASLASTSPAPTTKGFPGKRSVDHGAQLA